ncbi:DUF3086 domain-containing protein [Aphanothece hegewaldii CCALA 016]|uniref:DUF3086 domain-containing protein n=1 Tax=Aphanothece hegewaldii CCALA 016 TaxID=2107694 RepID=A0A2T1LUF2_9CHRO|nr:DUF3086 domain-containing protein [Aphanothece hegewaldii]PSF35165.1 DUF3086 domain-containing protein [Aphanothece hegewaldii CCALA 016]
MNSEEFLKSLDDLPLKKDDEVKTNSKEFDVLPSPFDEDDEENTEVEILKIAAKPEEISVPILSQQADDSIQQEIENLKSQKKQLETEVTNLKAEKERILAEQVQDVQKNIEKMVKEGVKELEQQKQALEISIEQLERRRDRIREEMRTTFAGVSQDLAIRVQGFKEYLVGSLQDLAAAAEQLELPSYEPPERPIERPFVSGGTRPQNEPQQPQFAKQGFSDQNRRIRELLDQYRSRPDYYGPAWQLRRTFEPIHAERVQNWFFNQGGRGAVRGMGSRLQNILIASSIISILRNIHNDRCRTLVLADSPERLGEWRRGLQDCLGISRADFGPERGVVLFESPEALLQKADRLMEEKLLPLIIIDDTEDRINLSLLQFPLWLAFALDPQQMSSYSF